LQKEITGLIVANMRPALPDSIDDFQFFESDDATLDAYVSYRRGRHVLDQPRSVESIEEAIEHFETALSIDPDYPAAHAGLCSAKTALYELDGAASLVAEAERICARAFEIGPRLPIVLRSVANLNVRTGDLQAAERNYRSALEIDSQDAASLAGLARVYERMRQQDEALGLIARAIDLQPGNWRMINYLASMHFRSGDYEKAADAYRKVVYLDGTNHIAFGNLGAASLMLARFSEARNALIASLEIEQNRIALTNLGIAHYYLGEFAESARVHREAVALADQPASGWLSLADALYFSGETEKALAAYETAAKLAEERLTVNPAAPEMLTTLGWAKAMLGETADAREFLTRCLDVAPDDPYSHYFVAIFEANFGDERSALAAAKGALDRGYSAAMLAAEPHLAGVDLSAVLQ
jgi:tetratricopeptide (TPR) repeat protein